VAVSAWADLSDDDRLGELIEDNDHKRRRAGQPECQVRARCQWPRGSDGCIIIAQGG
jgi:hypothetical protein